MTLKESFVMEGHPLTSSDSKQTAAFARYFTPKSVTAGIPAQLHRIRRIPTPSTGSHLKFVSPGQQSAMDSSDASVRFWQLETSMDSRSRQLRTSWTGEHRSGRHLTKSTPGSESNTHQCKSRCLRPGRPFDTSARDTSEI